MLRCDPAALGAARRRRAVLVALVAALLGGLAGAPFVLGGCNTPVQGDPFDVVRNVEADFNGATQTTSVTGTATGLSAPIVDKVTVGILAPTGVTPNIPVVTKNGFPVSVTFGFEPTVTAVLEVELQTAGVYSPPGEQMYVFETLIPLVISNGDVIAVSVQQTPPGPATFSNRLGAGGMLRSDIDDGTPYDTLQYVDNPVAYVVGGSPAIKPSGAAAWKTVNLAIGHSDGPLALPEQPNPNGSQVLDPLQIATLGPLVWANPDACKHVHAHGSWLAVPPHGDPQPTICGHGALLYFPYVTSSLIFPPDDSILLAGNIATLTASPTTTGFGVKRVDYHVDSVLAGSVTASPWSFEYTAPGVTTTRSVPWSAIAVDHNGVTATSEIFDLTLVAPLELMLSNPPTVVVGGVGGATLTADVTGGLPPLAVDLEVDNLIVDTQTGLSPFLLSYQPAATPTPYVVALRVLARDSVTQTASSPFFDVTVAPMLSGALTLARRAVVAGDSVTVTADVVGLPPYAVTFLANQVPFDSQVSGASTVVSSFSTPLAPATQLYQIRASVLDSVPQSATLTAAPDLTAVGTAAPPFVMLTEPVAGLEVLEGGGVTINAEVVGGVGGVARVDFFGNDEPIGSDTRPGDGFRMLWVADPTVGPGIPTGSAVPVDLRAVAEDMLGQTGNSDLVGILVLRGAEIPALGGAALGALTALVAGVGVYAAVRRRRSD